MSDVTKQTLFVRLLPLCGVLIAIFALFSKNVPVVVQWLAGAVALILVLAWLFAETGWIGGLIKRRLFPSKLSNDHKVRLARLLGDVNDNFSYSCIHSPFSVWHNISNDFGSDIRMNYGYHGAIQFWVADLKDQIENQAVNVFLLLPSLSKAISESTKLAEEVQRDLEEAFRLEKVTEQKAISLRKQWDSSKTHFNQWVSDWQSLFKELNHAHGLNCVEYFRPLEMVENRA